MRNVRARDPKRPSIVGGSAVAPAPTWPDWRLLFGLQLTGLLGVYIYVLSASGGLLGELAVTIEFSIVYWAICVVYAALIALAAATLPRKTGLPVMPIIDDWRAGLPNVGRAVWALGLAFCAGVLMAYGALYYGRELIVLGLDHPTLRRSPVSAPESMLSVACAVPLEEILFRATIFPALAAGLRSVWARTALSGRSIPVWFANVLQALMFGAVHIAAGKGVLEGQAWYVRLPLLSQTWTGLILGWLFQRCGLESALVCHLAFDVSSLAFWRRTLSLPPPP